MQQNKAKYAEIIISISHKKVDKGFFYEIPKHLEDDLKLGMRVLIPFGVGNKTIDGCVVDFCNEIDFDVTKVKSIIKILDGYKMFSQEMISLASWMKDKYYTTFSCCLQTLMPKGLKLRNDNTIRDYTKKVKYASINYDYENISEVIDQICKKNTPQSNVLNLLLEKNSVPVLDLKNSLKISDSPINTLYKKGIILIQSVEVRRNPLSTKVYKQTKPFRATEKQQNAIDYIYSQMHNSQKKPILIHGVTGSGKTEIYMQSIENVLKDGKQAIVLVPEISLTPQAVERFIGRFGDAVSVTHSRLSEAERFDQWKKAFDGEISIMIGPRSAVFTPFQNLGIIVLDEEHEGTYQSNTTPKYNAKDIAIKRSELTGCLVVLGSATPSINTYYEVEKGNFELISIDERINKRMPEIYVVDMRQELANANLSMFSFELLNEMKNALERKEQVILFLNRRGFSTFVSCRACGHVMSCDNCSVNYTYHMNSNKLICHYCAKEIENPKLCPICASKYIKYFGIGTQKLEHELNQLFPNARLLRMDMDTTSKKNSHDNIISAFANNQADILIGTQMIAKGLDFPNVSLVGIMAADMSVNQSDFRSAETAYQLLTQVSGRAGRASLQGKVYIQTYNPDHYSIQFTQSRDYISFYNHEITVRKMLNNPPFTHIFNILFESENEKKVIMTLNTLSYIMNHYNKNDQFEIIGPAPALVSKIKNKYRWKLFVKCENEEKLKNFVLYCIEKLSNSIDLSNVEKNLTINPIYMD